jgi:hypothetical protein
VIAVIGFVVAAAALGLTMTLGSEGETARAVQQPAAAREIVPLPEAATPSFDVVRVGEHGDAVLAGRALPKADVTLLDGDRELGRTTADDRGEWVLVPTEALPPGARSLSVMARAPSGEVARSSHPVILVVPADAAQPALAVDPRPEGGARLMLGPRGDAGPLTVDLVDRDEMGRLFVGGRAPGGATVQLYLDNRFLGRARSDGDGGWRLALNTAPGAGMLRADQVDGRGRVLARIEVPLAPPPPPASAAGDDVIVEPGASLWTIARRVYGDGTAYTIIYGANKDRIRDPDRIYPGQIVQVPRN